MASAFSHVSTVAGEPGHHPSASTANEMVFMPIQGFAKILIPKGYKQPLSNVLSNPFPGIEVVGVNFSIPCNAEPTKPTYEECHWVRMPVAKTQSLGQYIESRSKTNASLNTSKLSTNALLNDIQQKAGRKRKAQEMLRETQQSAPVLTATPTYMRLLPAGPQDAQSPAKKLKLSPPKDRPRVYPNPAPRKVSQLTRYPRACVPLGLRQVSHLPPFKVAVEPSWDTQTGIPRTLRIVMQSADAKLSQLGASNSDAAVKVPSLTPSSAKTSFPGSSRPLSRVECLHPPPKQSRKRERDADITDWNELERSQKKPRKNHVSKLPTSIHDSKPKAHFTSANGTMRPPNDSATRANEGGLDLALICANKETASYVADFGFTPEILPYIHNKRQIPKSWSVDHLSDLAFQDALRRMRDMCKDIATPFEQAHKNVGTGADLASRRLIRLIYSLRERHETDGYERFSWSRVKDPNEGLWYDTNTEAGAAVLEQYIRKKEEEGFEFCASKEPGAVRPSMPQELYEAVGDKQV